MEAHFMQRPHISIFDTTLRDGEQAPGCSMGIEDKLRMAWQLDRLGVDVIEAGFPTASEADFNAVHLIAREIRRPVIAGLARAHETDIRRAWLPWSRHGIRASTFSWPVPIFICNASCASRGNRRSNKCTKPSRMPFALR